MAQLGAVARHTVRGDREALPGLFDPIENKTWAVWHAVRTGPARTTAAKPANGPPDKGRSGVPGFEVEVNMTRVMRNLWGQAFTKLPSEDQARIASEIRQALASTGNAHCIRQPGIGGGQHDKPLWWIADVWNDVKVVGQFRTIVPTGTERRLTAEEAGETREPAPVEVKTKKDLAEAKRNTLAEIHARRRVEIAREREVRMEKILEVILEAEYPLYNTEVIERLDGVPKHATETLLREMCESGTIFRRLETKEERVNGKPFGRYHHLYWHAEPVPERDPALYRPTRTKKHVLDELKPGRDISMVHFGTPGPRAMLEDYVRRGIVEIVEINGEQRVRKLKDAPAESPEVVKVPPAVFSEINYEPPLLSNSLIQIAGALGELIEAEVERRTGGLSAETLRQELEAARRERDAARTELHGMTVRAEKAERELEQVRERTRVALGL